MADWREAVKVAKAEARRAREDADRLRQEARELEQRLRREASEAAQQGREGVRGARQSERSSARERRQQERSSRREGRAGVGGASTERPFETAGLTAIRLNQTAGELAVRMAAEGESPGVTTRGGRTTPKIEVERSGDELRIEIRLQAGGGFFRRRQRARTEVRLDLALALLSVDLGHGELGLEGLEAEALDLHCGAGEVRVNDCRGALAADAGAGRVAIRRHRGLVRCHSGAGDLSVDIAEVVPGEYALEAGLGRAELRLPPGEAVQIEARSGIGRVRIDYPSTDAAGTSVRLAAGIGEVSVGARADDADARAPEAAETEPPSGARHEAEEGRVLQLLEQGRVSAREAAELIAALRGAPPPNPPSDDADEASAEQE